MLANSFILQPKVDQPVVLGLVQNSQFAALLDLLWKLRKFRLAPEAGEEQRVAVFGINW